MNYKDYLKTITSCQFCELSLNKMIQEEVSAFMTFSLAPYSRHHLLIIPKRHIHDFEELSENEKKDIDSLLSKSIKLLKVLGHENYSILLRNGEDIGKSVKHLHYHLVPSSEVGSLENGKVDRNIMLEEEIIEFIKEFKEAESNL